MIDSSELHEGKDLPLVSVIVPTRNSEKYLAKCLKSINEQSYPNIEIVIVDRDSTDRTLEIAKSFSNYVYTWGPERSAQCNRGVALSNGRYVFRVDSDFYLDKELIRECVDITKKGFDAVVVHNSPLVIGLLSKVRKFETDMYKYSLNQSAARFMSKSTFLQIGGYSENITAGEDYDLQNKINKFSVSVGFAHLEAIHLDEPVSLFPVIKKFFYYGKDFYNFRGSERNKKSGQLKFFRNDFFHNWRSFVRNPFIGFLFVAYQVIKFISGGIGYMFQVVSIELGRLNEK